MSPANRKQCLMTLRKSFRNTGNNDGPTTLSWGTPNELYNRDETISSILTRCLRLHKKLRCQLKAIPAYRPESSVGDIFSTFSKTKHIIWWKIMKRRRVSCLGTIVFIFKTEGTFSEVNEVLIMLGRRFSMRSKDFLIMFEEKIASWFFTKLSFKPLQVNRILNGMRHNNMFHDPWGTPFSIRSKELSPAWHSQTPC